MVSTGTEQAERTLCERLFINLYLIIRHKNSRIRINTRKSGPYSDNKGILNLARLGQITLFGVEHLKGSQLINLPFLAKRFGVEGSDNRPRTVGTSARFH